MMREISQVRVHIENDAKHLFDLLHRLEDHVRRDRDFSGYIPYVNAWTRFAGMILQASKRTRSFDRFIKVEEQVPKKMTAKTVASLLPPRDNAFEELFPEYSGPSNG